METNTNDALFEFHFINGRKIQRQNISQTTLWRNWEDTLGKKWTKSEKLATGLQSLGLRENAHIGLISKNCREWIIADLAIMMAGYISVPFFNLDVENQHLVEL